MFMKLFFHDNNCMFYSYNEDYQYDSCISKGICSINPRTSSLREVLVMYLKQLAFYTLHLKYLGIKNNSTEDLILNTLSGLMSNLEVGNKQFYQTLINLKSLIIESIQIYKQTCKKRNITPKEVSTNIKLNKKLNITDLIQLGEKEFSKKLKSISDKKRNLYEIIFLVLKSLCINLVELKSFGENNNCVYSEILYLLNTINFPELSEKILIKKINIAVKIDYMLQKTLYKKRIENYGEQTEAEVNYTTYPNKAILVAGTNLEELKKVLDATLDKNVDVYTHGDMILAYTYPKFREYKHLKGQFGRGIENCLLDFATFPGAILIARHALENIEYLYRGRLFTTDNFIPQGVVHIKDDYSPLINSALNSKGFKTGKTRESVKIGCDKEKLNEILIDINKKIKIIKNIIIIGTEEFTQEQRDYYNTLSKYVKEDSFVISLSNYHNIKNFVRINSAPDFYMLYRILEKLLPTAKQNKTKISLFLAKCNKHTISNVINLKHMGVDNIFLNKCSPIMLNPTLTKTLKKIYDINPTTTVAEDLEIIFSGSVNQE